MIRSLTAIAGAAVMAATAWWSPAAAQTVVPLEAYARLPNVQSVQISPDGRRVAMITGAERDQMYAIVTPLDGGQPFAIPGFAQDISEALLFGVSWLSDNHLLISYRQRVRVPGGSLQDADVASRYVYNLNTQQGRLLERNANIESRLPDSPDTILISAAVQASGGTSVTAARGRGGGQTINLYEYNLDTGNYRRRFIGTANTVNWVLDDNAEPIIRQDNDRSRTLWRVFRQSGNRSNLVYEESYTLERFGRAGRRAISAMSNLVGLDYNGRGIWFSQLENRNHIRAYLFNPETGEVTGPHITQGRFDFGGFRSDWRTGKVIGAVWFEERRRTEWFDPEFQSLQEQLEGLFPQSEVTLSNWDLSGQRIIVAVEGGDVSSEFFLLDRTTGEMAYLTTAYPEVDPERIHPVEVVNYRARDGLELFGYLTLPMDREADNLPLLIVPHGGPQARDTYGFDPLFAQPYADMGYAVFQPQFRGGSGMGLEFVRRGHGQWGRAMQDDVSDAVLHLADLGVIDSDRVCIWGWSYGGYAALAGYALTPELYRCAIAGAPVSDIQTMMSWQADQLGGRGAVDYWTEYIGDWRVNRDQMRAISPLQNIANTNMPLMLIHPLEDNVVPASQSQQMYDAVRAAGKPVEYIPIEGDGHNLLFRRTRLITLEATTRFLMEHNPPDPR